MANVSIARLSEVFVEVADTLVGDFDVIEFLQKVTGYTSDLSGTRAAGMLLVGPQGHLQLMAASDERAEMLELFQLQAHEGPCQDCFRNGEQVINADLEKATAKWPQFAPTAVAAGYRSVHAFPMRLRDDVIGALNLFGDQPGEMTDEVARIVQALADIATIGLLQQRRALEHGHCHHRVAAGARGPTRGGREKPAAERLEPAHRDRAGQGHPGPHPRLHS